MISNEIITEISQYNDSDNGGDNALDGFDFQLSSAIYLMFQQLEQNTKFKLMYEKIEDFIIFTDEIHLYQAKSLSNSLTPNLLYNKPKKTKNDDTGLSIIEKMHNNFLAVKEVTIDLKIDSNLVMCENQSFSSKLSKKIKETNDIRKFNFNDIDSEKKQEIIEKTNQQNYSWEKMNAIRLIPKSRHEEVTRIYIEDVIQSLHGNNAINSLALYNALTCEIRKIRRDKSTISNDFLLNEIKKYTEFEKELNYSDYRGLLNTTDQTNILIYKNFNILLNTINIAKHPNETDYNRLRDFYLKNNYKNIYDFYNEIELCAAFDDIKVRLSEDEMKAMLLIIIGKELNI